jgi:hypothetical protein
MAISFADCGIEGHGNHLDWNNSQFEILECGIEALTGSCSLKELGAGRRAPTSIPARFNPKNSTSL